MSSQFIKTEVSESGVAVLWLDRPPVNAMGRQIREQFLRAMDDLGSDDSVRVIVLTATGKVFCAGADIKEKDALSPRDYPQANRLTRDSFQALLDSPKPVIAAVNGAAIGAGMVMVACCDMVVASNETFFAMPEIDVGLGGGASFLQRILPLSKLKRMMLTGERVPTGELYRLGMIEECVAPTDVLPTARRIAETIAAKSPTAVRTIRNSFRTVEQLPLSEGFRVEQNYTQQLSLTDDAREARLAFIEKRKAKFR